MSRRIVTLNQIFIENFISEGRHILYMSFASSSVRPKTLFLFDTESETQNGQYFWVDIVTSQNHISKRTFFKGRNLVKEPLEQILNIFEEILYIGVQFQAFQKLYSQKIWKT